MFSAKEDQLLKEFRERVNDVLETEEQRKNRFLVRWLRARDGDLYQAEYMLRASLAWRKEKKIDFILELPVDVYFEKEFPYYIKGVDKLGQPVAVIPIGKWDFRKCAAQGKTEEFKQYINYALEDVYHVIEKYNKIHGSDQYPITQYTILLDWKGYSYMQLCDLKAVQTMLYSGITFDAHYPEVLS